MRWVVMAMVLSGCPCEVLDTCPKEEEVPVALGDPEIGCDDSTGDQCIYMDLSVVDESTETAEETQSSPATLTNKAWSIEWYIEQYYDDPEDNPDVGPILVDAQEFGGAELDAVYPIDFEDTPGMDTLPGDISNSTYVATVVGTADGDTPEEGTVQQLHFGFDSYENPSGFRDVWVSGSGISGSVSGTTCTLKVQFTGGCFSASGFDYEVFSNGVSQFTYTSGSTKPTATAGSSTVGSSLSSANKKISGSFTVASSATAYRVQGTKEVTGGDGTPVVNTCYNVSCGSTVTATKAVCP